MTSFKCLMMVVIPAISLTLALTTPAPSETTTPTPVGTASCWTTTFITAAPVATGGVQLWWQCGGLGYTGPDICVQGSKCTQINQYYSQCQPVLVTVTSTICS